MKLWMVFDPAWSPQWLMLGYSSTLRATAVLSIAFLLTRAIARSAPATRAGIWAAALAVLLPLPWMREIPVTLRFDALPGWLSFPITETGRALVVQSSPYATPLPWTTIAACTWLLGALVLTIYSALQFWRVRPSLRRTRPASQELATLLGQCAAGLRIVRYVRLRIASDAVVPFTVGAWRPVIVLPEDALSWPHTHLRSVLLHELAHVRRHDSVTGLLGHLACVMWWFHPGVWLGVRSMCRERESACDALVLSCGIESADYAEALLLSAPHSLVPSRSSVAAPAAAGSVLAARIRAILSSEPNTGSRAHVAIAAAFMLAVACTAAATKLAPGSETLARMLQSSDWVDRAYAAESIARIGSEAEVRGMVERMNAEPNGRVRAHARFGEQIRIAQLTKKLGIGATRGGR